MRLKSVFLELELRGDSRACGELWKTRQVYAAQLRVAYRRAEPFLSIRSWFRTRASLQVEILASPPPGRRPQEVSAPPASSKLWGPTALGWAIAHLVAMALGVAYCEARNGHRLAPQRIPPLLDLENWARYSWQARGA